MVGRHATVRWPRPTCAAAAINESAPRIAAPLLVVDGDQDVIPGVTNGEPLARLAPHGTYLSVPHGDHLLGNARPDWLPHLSDHITHTLTATGTPA
ncbi:hypothetical protein JCM4814A_82530 [Streptomyces phaeofaciens JCM 4814]|uniref:Uncharacterized protein n=1 Tax=Streptomyces phaeofaciens TaxID=68254 RepID=A0A918HR17_9ACTN|nr:hypothetical protein [Streptomyces phaeofaciens]GGT90245.1 hypothetical protein GCM10010226_80530 [Streptomyces phaeofaciens]